MAYQRKTTKIGNNTKVTRTVHSNGSQRFTTTTKHGNVTRSQSWGKDGRVKTTTTVRHAGGWIDRKSTTPSKAKPYKHPKPLKTTKSKPYRPRRSRSRKVRDGDGLLDTKFGQFVFGIMILIAVMFFMYNQ